MEFRLLGPLEVWDGQRPVAIHGAKERALLALLLLDANRLVSNDRLVDELWGDDPPATARKSLQVRVSNLRKTLRGVDEPLVSTGGGYLIRLEPDQLDVTRFERLLAEAEEARGDPARAAAKLTEALALWRGPALADLVTEPFAQLAAGRLEELRLVALERRLEAELELGRHVEAVAELEALVSRNPFRERLRAQLMLALYRSGRQAEALAAYRDARSALIDGLGIEPSPMLHALETAILRQDAALELAGTAQPDRSILVAAQDDDALAPLLDLAKVLARAPAHELIVVRAVATGEEVAAATALVNRWRKALIADGVAARAAAFASARPFEELVRIAVAHEVDLLLLRGGPEDAALQAPCDVAVLVVRPESYRPGPVLVPFTGAPHDWTALELGAWAARASRSSLRLAGRDDASRLLAHASLAVQRSLGVGTESVLVPSTGEELARAAADAALVVLGVPERREGLGPMRLDVVRRARPPVLLVRRGPRPGGLAPRESLTRFTWSLA